MGILALSAMLGGCAYSGRSHWPEGMSLAVPEFTDKLPGGEFSADVPARATRALRYLVATTGEFKLANASQTDFRLDCIILNTTNTMVTSDRFGDPLSQRFLIEANVSLWSNQRGKYVLQNIRVDNRNINPGSGMYDLSQGESVRSGRNTAINDLARAIYHVVFELNEPPNDGIGLPSGK